MTKIQIILKQRKMSQKDLLDAIKATSKSPIPQYLISKIVSGKAVNYHVHTLLKICRALEVTPNEILRKKDYDDLFQ
jgi:DNA-binding Xre family transcriptional regulator